MRNSMRRETYTVYGRNRNTVRHMPKNLGSITLMGIVALMVLIVGLIYVSQSTKATSYDYALSDTEMEISELTAEKEDLAVEKARLTSVAQTENSKVAQNMQDGEASGYVSE